MVRSTAYCASIRVINLAKEILLEFIVKDERFWSATVKVVMETVGFKLDEYFNSLLPREKNGRPAPIQEFDYRNWA